MTFPFSYKKRVKGITSLALYTHSMKSPTIRLKIWKCWSQIMCDVRSEISLHLVRKI